VYVGLHGLPSVRSGRRCRTRKDAISFGYATVLVVDDGVRGDRSRVVHAGQVGPATFAACGRQA